jgi:ABC-type antimicrobial peptide transport system permease subunit
MQDSSSQPPPNPGTLSLGRLVTAGLRYHWRTNLAVALAVMASSAVLTGALLVGDSMRGSLRHLLLDQLGQIDEVLVTDRFFRSQLADEIAGGDQFQEYFSAAVPAVYVQGTVDNPQSSLRAGQVGVIGAGSAFWKLGHGGPDKPPGRGEIVLNEPLAREIGAKLGDEVLLRIGSASQIPADSALGRKTETIRNRRLKVSAVIPAEGLGRLALNPSQLVPLAAFVAPETLQDALEQPGKANAIFVAGRTGVEPTAAAHETLDKLLRPKLVDYGISIEPHKFGYVQLTSNRMLVDPLVVEAADRAFTGDGPRQVLTYLANTIALGDKQIPYSTIAALDFLTQPPLGPFNNVDGKPVEPLADDEIVLNTWAAEDLSAKLGDAIEIVYFEPESTHGKVREAKATFRLKDIVPIAGLAGDPDLTPQMPGVTDQASIGDWDPPFPFESGRVRDKDEQYWDEHRTTPKAFVSLAAGRKLWSSRFGDTTAVRFAPPPGPTFQAQANQLVLKPESLGFIFRPIKRLGLEAARGTTAFDGLFVGFSLFIMVASLLLVALLFRLGIEQRAAEIGVLRTVGLRNRRIIGVLAAEGLAVTAIGSLLGVIAGVGYAWLMLVGLTTWWLSAISTPFLQLYVTPMSLLIGFAGGLIVSLLTVLWTLRRLNRISVRRLLAGQASEDRFSGRSDSRVGVWAAGILLLVAAGCAAMAPWLRGEAQAGAFVGSGALVLAAALTFLLNRLRRRSNVSLTGAGNMPIARLAARNGARNPGRSVLSIGLIAAASFLIVALSAFRLDPTTLSNGRDSGSGGFALVAQSDAPIYQNLNDAAAREELGMSADADEALAKCQTVSLRVESGDDASCLNLYQAIQPRVLGVPAALVERGGFDWGGSQAETAVEQANPWLLLGNKLPDEADGTRVVPAVVDFNTATYSLHKGLGDKVEVVDGHGRTVQLRLVGFLKNSIFQGDLLVGEQQFLELFPEVNGYRFILVDTQGEPVEQVQQLLEESLGDYGFDAETSTGRLAAFFAVQNTYLSTFQSLGGLGLLLGTFGLATVQLRSVLERRGELALMRAAGFRRALLTRLVMLENTLLLVGGLLVGVVAALVAVLPHWLGGGASVPWLSLAATLATVLIVGLLAGLLAVRATLRAELIPALRED